jgi:hypothetical protein
MDWVGEGDPIPVVSGSTGALQLSVRKMGVITVASRELAKRSAAEQIFATMLRREAGRALDRAIFATDAGDATKVAGLLAGVSPIDGGPFGTVGEALSGLAGALADAGGSGEVFIAASPATAARIMIEHPQLAWTIAPSRALSAGQVVAIDPLGCVFGAGDTVDLESAVAALLHMSDVPSPIVDTAAADPTRSLWQTDGIATRLIVDLAFAARPGAVALVEGVS